MAKEVERKFLVTNNSYREQAVEIYFITQGYLSRSKESTVRIRVRDRRAFLTIKGVTVGFTRNEWEYEIPVDDARAMLGCCRGGYIEKRRYIVPFEGHRWEVDEFVNVAEIEGDGMLVVAEIELTSESEQFAMPGFIGREVTSDSRYYNSQLQPVSPEN